MRAFPIIMSSPSGGGKTTVIQKVLEQDTTLARVVTATTRAPRKGEKNGKDYHFWTEKQFLTAVKKDQMLEWAHVHTSYYGIPKSSVESLLKKGICPVLVIDVQGAQTLAGKYPQAVKIFLMPPSMAVLKKRLLARNDNTQDVELRLKTAKKEVKEIPYYDYLVLNDSLQDAVKDTLAIIRAEQLKTIRYSKQDLTKFSKR